jgi:hypothetical protein
MVKAPRSLVRYATFALALTSAACVAVLGMDKLSEKQSIGPAVCREDNIGEPGKPASSAAPGARELSVYFALKELDLGINPGAERAGFNLDHQITTATDLTKNGCVFPDGGDIESILTYGVDPPSGVDNANTLLLTRLASFQASIGPVEINARLVERQFGIVLRIDGWNGTKNDENVQVLLFPAIGHWQKLPYDAGLVPGAPVSPFDRPFDPGDLWMPDMRFQLGDRGSSLISTNAWVNDGRLVARYDLLTVPIRSSPDELRSFDIELRDAWITGILAPPESGGRASLERGVVGGRIKASAVGAQLRLLFDMSTGTYLCAAGNPLSQFATDFVCGVRDIRSSHCDDGKSLPCDALSFGARFETYSVDDLGPFRERSDDEYRDDAGRLPPAERCPDAGDVDCPP